MSDVTRHYDTLLAQHYSWMMGVAFDAKVTEQRALLEMLGAAGRSGTAIDLGCGPGYQSVALAKLGFAPVVAVDSCQPLLDELVSQAGALPIRAACADMRDLSQFAEPGTVALVACMGDTLTHLESRGDVSRLFAAAYRVLAPGGLLVLTFRDLCVELKGLDRFLPVRSDADKIMTCVLEYEVDRVIVNDLIHVRDGGGWTLHKSCYRKLRLSAADVSRELSELGFTVQVNQAAGRLQAIAAVRSR
jgi:SAM-dependent methyltransferase